MGPKAWWIIVVGFTRDDLDESNLTQAQEDCLQLDAHTLYYLTCALHEDVFRRVWDMKSAHDMWTALQDLFGDSSMWDMERAHEDVEHSHNSVIVEDCSTSWSSDDDDSSTRSMMMQQGMQMMMLLHAHLLLMKMMDMRVMSLQAHQHHHIALCHKVTQRYKMLMWLIILIQMMSLLVDLLA